MGLSHDKGSKKTKDIENKNTEALDKKALIKESVKTKELISINSIKSEFIIKKIFSNLQEKSELEIIIYSKKYQNILGINLDNFIELSGKYIKGERNGRGREYVLYKKYTISSLDNNNDKYEYTDKLIFSGEYKDGKRNGEGIEYYDSGRKKYVGFYKNGKRNGKGKKYYDKDPYTYEELCEKYLKGSNLSIEDQSGKMLTSSNRTNDNKNDDNKDDDNDLDKLLASLNKNNYNENKSEVKSYDDLDELLASINKNKYNNNDDKENEKKEEKEEKYDDDPEEPNLKFKGEYLNGYIIEGQKYYDNGKLKFELLKSGIGKYYYHYEDQLSFEGEFKYGKKNGKGKEYSYNGILVFEGEYLNGQRHGKGKEYYQYKRAPGLCGSYFCNGDEEGKLIFEGEYKNGKIWNGKGYGKDFEGEYKNGERWNGYGREYVRHLMGCTQFEYKLYWSGKYVNGIKIGYPEN